MAWGRIQWLVYNCKHCPDKSTPWPEQVKSTKRRPGPAKYALGVNIRELEESVVKHRQPLKNEQELIHDGLVLLNGRSIKKDGPYWYLYRVCDEFIGASMGELTKILMVQWHDVTGELHGHPITEQELIRNLKDDNPDELNYFNRTRARK